MEHHAAQVLTALTAARTRCGAGWLVYIDGVSAAGKSTLSAEVSSELRRQGRRVRTLHTDAMLQDWSGLPQVGATVAELVEALASGNEGRWREWDWDRGAWSVTHTELPLAEGEVVVLEGVGAASGEHVRHAAVVVWMDTPASEQAQRWRDRGDDLTRLSQWQADEQALHQLWSTRDGADVVIE